MTIILCVNLEIGRFQWAVIVNRLQQENDNVQQIKYQTGVRDI